jgi:hypothetical protein
MSEVIIVEKQFPEVEHLANLWRQTVQPIARHVEVYKVCEAHDVSRKAY